MFIFRVLLCFFVLISSISSEDLLYDFGNGDETNELLSVDYEYSPAGSEQDESFNMSPSLVAERENSASKIDILIASVRESAVDILQDIGDLEDVLAERNDSRNNNKSATTQSPSSTTSKYVLNDMTIPSKSANVTREKPKDVLEEGKAKLKVWEEQIKVCKSILENARLSKKDEMKTNLIKAQEKKKPVVTDKKKKSDEDKDKEKLKRRRRRLLREGMENFRQVYAT